MKIHLKKIDQVIVKTFIGPFIAVFFVTVLALTLQIIWLYLDDFVGKGADFMTILESLLFMAASMVPLALPLAVLIASIMTYGHLAETFELVILRASGISSIRIMLPIGITALVLCGFAFMFNNYFIPKAELKKNRLMYEIIASKPAFDLQPGQFYDKIDGYILKIDSKDKNNQDIYGVIIYENEGNNINNIILAKHGKMALSHKTNSLLFTLYDGAYYQRIGEDQGGGTNTYSRTHFDEYKKEFQLWSFLKTSDQDFTNNKKLFSVRQLDKYIDSIKRKITSISLQLNTLFCLNNTNIIDSLSSKKEFASTTTTSYIERIPDSLRNHTILQTKNIINALLSNFLFEEQKNMYNNVISYQIEWHRKISLSIAC
ncbi:MAG: LptF/LptG family permease, partial [Chitinophagaceae bacterium]